MRKKEGRRMKFGDLVLIGFCVGTVFFSAAALVLILVLT